MAQIWHMNHCLRILIHLASLDLVMQTLGTHFLRSSYIRPPLPPIYTILVHAFVHFSFWHGQAKQRYRRQGKIHTDHVLPSFSFCFCFLDLWDYIWLCCPRLWFRAVSSAVSSSVTWHNISQKQSEEGRVYIASQCEGAEEIPKEFCDNFVLVVRKQTASEPPSSSSSFLCFIFETRLY